MDSVSLLGRGAALLAAVSGGGDSVALLHALAALGREVGCRLGAVHVDHGLRGSRSQEDAAFVQALCRELEIPLLLYRAQLSGSMESPGMEEKARQARRAFYLRAMEELQADAVLLAHHREDQAETVLMRLLRGAGARGLGGMRPAVPFGRGVLLRPFLALPREALRSALLGAGGTWREDESNLSSCCLRNRLRLEVMPLLEECQSQAAAHMAQTAQRLQWDEECLHALARERFQEALVPMPSCHALALAPLRDMPPALLVRVLRIWAQEGLALAQGHAPVPPVPEGAGERSLSHGDSLGLLALAQGQGPDSLNLPQGLKVLRGNGFLHLLPQGGSSLLSLPQAAPLTLDPAQEAYRLASHAFGLSPWPREPARPPTPRELLLPRELLAQGLCLRFPQPGDRISPLGAPGAKPLRRLFTDRKVPAPFRALWPVLARESRVYWVPLVALAQEARLPPGAQDLLCLSLESPLPLLP
ncbi:MAG: tRNA lysidine(34) synthetase TilS [Candidatus Limiplasma sp.]|nr:tRNA lysidine(34) synthetase TilS [Candidatus Limiplasma sp.]